MKIVGFSQLYNEKENGNLENWMRCMTTLCDKIYIYDQKSTDGSHSVYASEKKCEVIYSEINDFSNELICKKKLLQLLLQNEPDTDWIFWMDGDTVIERKGLDRKRMEQFLKKSSEKGVDGIALGHYNMWRSKNHYRIDSQYHDLHEVGRVALWKNNGKLNFPTRRGLHHKQYPIGMFNVKRANLNMLHMGFADDHQIIQKYKTYKDRGQSGWALERLLDETNLTVVEVEKEVLPEWMAVGRDKNPKELQSLREIYEKNNK